MVSKPSSPPSSTEINRLNAPWRRNRLWLCRIAVAASLFTANVPAYPLPAKMAYTIQPEDTLCLISTRYYNAPTAAVGIYQHNKKALDAANKGHDPSPQWIFPGTVIELPLYITSNGTRYERRETPMELSLAKSVANPQGIKLNDLIQVSQQRVLAYKSKAGGEPIKSDHKPIISSLKAVREPAPQWFSNPDRSNKLVTCAKTICNRFMQLCYFECLLIAKRLSDGDEQSLCDTMESAPPNTFISLPYEVDQSTRTACSELTE